MSDPIMPLYVEGETILVTTACGIRVYAEEYDNAYDLYADIVEGNVVVKTTQKRNSKLDEVIYIMLEGGMRTMPIIKAVRYLSNCGLKEAKDYVQSHYNYNGFN